MSRRVEGAVGERPRPVPELGLDLLIPQANHGRRHRGQIPELVGMMLAEMGIEGTPFEDQYQMAARAAIEWGQLDWEPADVREWRKLGVHSSHTAAMLLKHGITPRLCRARPWHTKRHDPQQDTIINRVLGASVSHQEWRSVMP